MKQLIILFLLISSFLAAQQKNYTLEESLAAGLKKDKQIKNSRSRLSESAAQVNEVSSNFYPQLFFGANYTRLSDVPPFEVSVPFTPNPITIQESILNTYTLKLSLQQPIFTGFRLSSLKLAAEKRRESVEQLYELEINNAALNIYESFWNFYKAEEFVNLLTENISALKIHLEDTRKFLDNGLATRNDLLKLEVQYSNLELELIKAENILELSRINFNKAIGIDLDSETEISAGEIEVELNLTEPDKLIPEALKNRKELQALYLQADAASAKITSEKSDWFPQVSVFGDFFYSRPNQRILPLEDKFADTWNIGVALNWNILDWGNTSAKVAQAKEKKLQTEISLDILRENIETEIYKLYFDLLSGIKKVKVNRLNVEQTEENYRITKDKYTVQYATSSDLIDAEVSALDAKTNLTASLVEYELAKVRLEKALGRKIY